MIVPEADLWYDVDTVFARPERGKKMLRRYGEAAGEGVFHGTF
jgi:hypothetical protein